MKYMVVTNMDNILQVANILKGLHMLKGSDIISNTTICKNITINFRIFDIYNNPEAFISKFYNDYNEGKYNEYLKKREYRRDFYLSRQWLDLRKKVYATQPNKCVLCGSKKNLSIDHIKSRYTHPELELDINNCQIMCLDCNITKSYKKV